MTAGRLVFPALRWRDDTGFSHESAVVAEALAFGAGGFIIFGGTADATAELTARIRGEAGRPLLFAADLERGAGQQFLGLDELPPPLALASLDDPAVLRGAGILTAIEALSVGINWILAPVADLDITPENPIVQTRSFGADPARVAAAATAWIVGCEAAGGLACAKHFPGHGRTRTDSHVGVPVVSADAELLRETDLAPFRAAVEVGVGSLMTAHVAFPALDPTGTPATFSRPILDILRRDLGYEGLIVSDALMMEGARAGRTPEGVAREAVRAGVDLLLYPDAPGATAAGLERAMAEDPDVAARVAESLARYDAALGAVAMDDLPERPPPTGSVVALADWLMSAPLLRGEPPRLTGPIALRLVDDDLGGVWPASSTEYVAKALAARGVPVGPGGSLVLLCFAEPRASKGRAGFGPESLARLTHEADGAALIILFGHPRLAAALPGTAPILLAWHRQRLMQEGAARWIAAHLG